MDILSKVIKLFFGSKADKDRKEIMPYVEKIKAIYPSITKLTNDELRERSQALSKAIADFIAEDEARIAKNTRVYAKKQLTWMKKDDSIHRLNPATALQDLLAIIQG